MNARTIPEAKSAAKSAPLAPRFDKKFIEDHKLIERYLENKLPFKGARDLEKWCRAHPEYLNESQAVRARPCQPEVAGSERPAAGSAASRSRLGGRAPMC